MPPNRVFPEIPRLPREPRLEGPPHKASDSVFNYPGAVDAAAVIVEFDQANSAQRRNLAIQAVTGRSSEAARLMVNGLVYLTDPGINTSSEAIKTGEMALEALAKQGLVPEVPDDLWERNPNIAGSEKEFIGQNVAWMKLANEVTEYSMLSEEKQKGFIKTRADTALNDPWELEEIMTGLMDDAPEWEESPFIDDVLTYGQRLREEIMAQAGSERFTLPENEEMYGWLCLHKGIDYEEESPHQAFTQQVAEKHLSSFASRAYDPNSAVDFVYAVLVGGLPSGNQDIAEHAMRISMGKTQILPADSVQYYDFMLSYALSTGASREKAREIQAVRPKYEGMLKIPVKEYLSSTLSTRFSKPYKEHQDARINAFIEKYGRKSTEVRQAVADIQNLGTALTNIDVWRRGIMPKKKFGRGKREENALADAEGPLVEYLEETALLKEGMKGYKFNPRKQLALIAFPGTSEFIRMPHSEIVAHIKTKIAEADTPDEPLASRAYWNTLSYLLPEGTGLEQLNQMAGLNKGLVKAMQEEPIHTLSPRGDMIEIVDPTLNALGFESITYKMADKDKSKIDISVQVGKLTYKARLGSDFKIVTSMDGELLLPEAGIFLENVILSHLHEIICTDNVGEVSDNGDVSEQRKAFSSRRAHRRVLSEGKGPTPGQVLKIMEEYGIDLIQRNRERLDRGEDRMITWVSEVDAIALGGKGPVVSKAPNATKALQEILAKS